MTLSVTFLFIKGTSQSQARFNKKELDHISLVGQYAYIGRERNDGIYFWRLLPHELEELFIILKGDNSYYIVSRVSVL